MLQINLNSIKQNIEPAKPISQKDLNGMRNCVAPINWLYINIEICNEVENFKAIKVP